MTKRCLPMLLLPFALFGTTASADAPDVLVSAALGDDLGGRPLAIDLDTEGNVVLGGVDERGGTLVRFDAAGLETDARALAMEVDDLAVDRGTGDVAVVGATAVMLLGPDLELVWQQSLPPRPRASEWRVAVGELGTVAVADGELVQTFDAHGRLLGSVPMQRDGIAAVAVLDHDDRVVLVGSSRDGGCASERAWVSAYTRAGSLRWEGLGADGCADSASRGVDVVRGDDGLVYVLAEVEAGGTPFADAVAFDASTDRRYIESSPAAYYARFTPDGVHVAGQYLGFADELSMVRPVAIAADLHGNVHVAGVTTHDLAEPDEVAGESAIVDALAEPSAFHQVIAADFGSRLSWHALVQGGATTELAAFALAGSRSVALVGTWPTTAEDDADVDAGPMVLVSPTEPKDAGGPEKRPDREDVGTFGYESGVSGADPTCYCDARRRDHGVGVLGLFAIVLVRGRRRRS